MIFPIVVILIIIFWIIRTVNEKQANARYKQRALNQGKDWYIDVNGCKYWISDDLPFEFIKGDDGDIYEINPFNGAIRRNTSQEARDYYAERALEWAKQNDLRFYPYENLHEDHMDQMYKTDIDAICGFRFKDRFSDNIYAQRKFNVVIGKVGYTVIFWFNIKTKMFDFVDKNCLDEFKQKFWHDPLVSIEDLKFAAEEKLFKLNLKQKEYIEKKETTWFKHDGAILNWNYNLPDNNMVKQTYPFPIPTVKYEPKHQ